MTSALCAAETQPRLHFKWCTCSHLHDTAVQAQDPDCQVSKSQLAGAEEPGAHVHTFLTLQRLRSNSVPELPVHSPAMVCPASPARSVPALAQPSRVRQPDVFLCSGLNRWLLLR